MKFEGVSRKVLKKKGFPQPVSLSKELMENMTLEQKKVLFELYDLREELKGVKEGVISQGAVTLCEDDDDLRVITMGDEKGLNIQAKIRGKLQETLDRGLGSLKIIQDMCATYNIEP